MSKLTRYTKPSVRSRIASAASFSELAELRALIERGLDAGIITATDDTVEDWAEALWSRLLWLMAHAVTARELCLLRNGTLRWVKPPCIAAKIDEAFQARAPFIRSDAERLLDRGIEIQGVTRLTSLVNIELKRSSLTK